MSKKNLSIKGKILIAFLVSTSAIIGSYYIYDTTIKNIFNSLKSVSVPNQKLLTVHNLFTEINESGKSFKSQVIDKKSLENFFIHSEKIKEYTDSLEILCAGHPYLLSLIDSVSGLIDFRQQYLLKHAKYLQGLNKNNPINDQIHRLDSMVAESMFKSDSMVVTHEHKQVTTKTKLPKTEKQEEKRSFLNRLFKSSKKNPDSESEQKQKIIQEVLSIKTDTVVIARDTSIGDIQELIRDIEKVQQQRQLNLTYKETEFANFINSFDSKIYQIFSAIETDIVRQTSVTLQESEQTINLNANRIFIIILLFFLFFIGILILIITDVSKSNKYKNLLEIAMQNEKASSLSKQRFLANMSHEIRTPLQSIIGYSELLLNQSHQERKYIQAIHTSSEHLLQIVNEILDYNRINSGKFTFEKSNFNCLEIVEEVISLLLPQAEKKGIQLTFESKMSTNPMVHGDSFRLKQILLNILGNGIKFTKEGHVHLKMIQYKRPNGYQVFFHVQDTGIGIQEESLSTIFEQFEQVSTPNQPQQGTGLGLSISKSLIEEQGGSLFVESEVGKGTCFTFQIPYEYPVMEQEAQQELKSLPPAFKGFVCLIDDDSLILQLCSAFLNKHEIAHKVFHSAEDFLKNLPTQMPDKILMDIRLPGMDGFELCAFVKKHYSHDLKVIALTAQALPEEKTNILNYGFDDILLKPFKERDLLRLFGREDHKKQNSTNTIFTEDPSELKEIYESFIDETSSDIQELNKALANKDNSIVSLLLHKLAGRTAQLGETRLGMAIRSLELKWNSDPQNFEPQDLAKVLAELEDFIISLKSQVASC